MVAFELARYFEANGNTADAGRWYLTAAERFRRSDWKTKAQESATRLGATEPAEIREEKEGGREAGGRGAERGAEKGTEREAARNEEREEERNEERKGERAGEFEQEKVEQGRVEQGGKEEQGSEEAREELKEDRPAPAVSVPQQGHRRGRGRRDQRGHRRGGHGASPAREKQTQAPTRPQPEPEPERDSEREVNRAAREVESIPSLRGKYGDPGLSSRLTQLEMNFRRLLACSPAKLEDAAKAPAGPGVWVLTDSDLTTYYYVEACQTLRVAIPHILKGSTPRRGEGVALKPALAEHLGIPEARVAKYLSDHCVVRWLQMDDDAAHFAHFLVAVLRPALNE